MKLKCSENDYFFSLFVRQITSAICLSVTKKGFKNKPSSLKRLIAQLFSYTMDVYKLQ